MKNILFLVIVCLLTACGPSRDEIIQKQGGFKMADSVYYVSLYYKIVKYDGCEYIANENGSIICPKCNCNNPIHSK